MSLKIACLESGCYVLMVLGVEVLCFSHAKMSIAKIKADFLLSNTKS